jgi:hypothetical protein
VWLGNSILTMVVWKFPTKKEQHLRKDGGNEHSDI